MIDPSNIDLNTLEKVSPTRIDMNYIGITLLITAIAFGGILFYKFKNLENDKSNGNGN